MSSYPNKNKLVVQNIRKSFEGLSVIEDISLQLNENEFVSLLGLSGSGKSTIFNIIAGLLKPDSGKVIIDGEDYTEKSGRVSYMYQKDLLMPWRKVIDNACLPLMIKGEKKKVAREQVAGYFKLFGLEGFEYQYPFQLSGGMRQRVALMRTYMFSKDILLLDEPFGGLDAITRSKMHAWLLTVLKELKTSILFITHDIEEAILLSDRIYILSDRPASIREEINIVLPRPRHPKIITSSEFNEIKSHIVNRLKDTNQ